MVRFASVLISLTAGGILAAAFTIGPTGPDTCALVTHDVLIPDVEQEVIIEDAADEVNEDPSDKPNIDLGQPDPEVTPYPRTHQPRRDDRAHPHKFKPRPRPDIIRP